MNPPAPSGIDPIPGFNTNGVISKENSVTVAEPSATTEEAKKVTITEPANEDGPDHTVAQSDAHVDAVELDGDLENVNIPMEMGVGKKKKKKSKPKSKRGLVVSQSRSSIPLLTTLGLHRMHQPDSKSTTSTPHLHQQSMRKKRKSMTGESLSN